VTHYSIKSERTLGKKKNGTGKREELSLNVKIEIVIKGKKGVKKRRRERY